MAKWLRACFQWWMGIVHLLAPRAVAAAAESAPVADALVKVKAGLATALAQVDEALRAVEVPSEGEAGAIETR